MEMPSWKWESPIYRTRLGMCMSMYTQTVGKIRGGGVHRHTPAHPVTHTCIHDTGAHAPSLRDHIMSSWRERVWTCESLESRTG